MKLKAAILGCGRISVKHIEAIVNNYEEIELVALCDTEALHMEEKEKKYFEYLSKANINTEANTQVKKYLDYKEMLQNEALDLVAVATESGKHASMAIACLLSGAHVIVEKPMALSIEDADLMIKTAREQNRKLAVCHQNRFNPPIQKLRKAIEGKKFGKLIHGVASIRWNRNDNYYQQAPWRGTWAQDGGTLMNQCIHNIDLLQWMLGDVDTIYAQTDTFLRNIEAEDCGVAVVRFKNGALGIIEGTACVYPKNLEETLNIFGENGTVCIGGLAVNRIETWDFADIDMNIDNKLLTAEDPDTVYGAGHTPLFKDMIEAIKNDREPYITGEEGKKAMEIVLAIYQSNKTGQVVKLPLGPVSTLNFNKI
ncbi:MAG: Gfo/Idh/MocA family oxidoreductase [Clostridia bacterium]|nr:Gfo/Idh/MocA family oxidoreductase [Clostridia bacterium]